MKEYGYVNFVLISLLLVGMVGCTARDSEWKVAPGPLFSKWAKMISPDSVHQEYPRPQLVRQDWLNLNGLWDYSINDRGEERPQGYDGKILVPFPIESSLSGVMRDVGEENELWYKKSFMIPKEWLEAQKRILLHFGAVDWEATVWVNGKRVGKHKGGYDAFSFDITEKLLPDQDQELVLKVWDPVDKGTQPRGKQVQDPQAIWYTSVTGIWQTVWLEPVNKMHIESIKLSPDIDRATLSIDLAISEIKEGQLLISNLILDGKELSQVHTKPGNSIVFDVDDQKLWTPDTPVLYDVEVMLLDVDGTVIDDIRSYAGMRKISIEKYGSKIPRIFLNNEFVFQLGPLDQGWWPDGLYTAPSDEALKYDVEVTKKLGFNMARKHVKVEPARWYYWCDKLGLLVWQDMPSGDEYIGQSDPDIERTNESAEQFELELKELITQFGNHPSIVIWVPFNEGWGQYDTGRIVDYVKSIDPSRLVINTSGWADRGVGDIHDIHAYPGPAMPKPEKKRALVLGEFGGLGLPLEGHTWQSSDNWGYRSYKNPEELTLAYTNLIYNLFPLVNKGLSAAVYTQTTDVEVEVNGLMTYDRAVIKMNPEVVRRLNQGYVPPLIEAKQDIFISSLGVDLSNEMQDGKIYYTLDGSRPTTKSTLYEKTFEINSTKTIRAITMFEDGKTSGISEKTFRKVDYTKAKEIDNIQPGINYEYYLIEDKDINLLPDFEKLTPNSKGTISHFNLEHIDRREYFALRFTGLVHIPKSDIYTFSTNSNDGSNLYIGDELVVDNDYGHGMLEKSGAIALGQGLHPIQVLYFQSGGGKGLEVSIESSGARKQQIPKDLLFHK